MKYISILVSGLLLVLTANSALSKETAGKQTPTDLSDTLLSYSSANVANPFAPFSVFVVNTAGDSTDAIPGDGICNDGFGDCSLRAAIQEANAFPGANNIDFNIPGGCPQSIFLPTALPPITEPVVINGYSQPGSLTNTATTGSNATLCVILDGFSAGGFNDGLRIDGVNSTIRGLNIRNWGDAGIEIGTGNGSIIEGNFIGTNEIGTGAMPNRIGVTVFASNVLVGGSTLVSRNIISGNVRNGIALTEPGSGSFVRNNQIGLGANSATIGNGETGVNIFRSANNQVGGTTSSVRNVISGNGFSASGGTDGSGISILGDIINSSPGNVIAGNYIGADPFGMTAAANAHNGIRIFGAINNTIGGGSSSRNLISGNIRDGVLITGPGNTGNSVRGNTIGLDNTRVNDLGNGSDGVEINGPSNSVGGTGSGEGNWVAGNNVYGIHVNGTTATSNVIEGNTVGMNLSGTPVPQNGGIVVIGANNNQIGGTVAEARNVVGGNFTWGIVVASSSGTVIQRNWVGIGASGLPVANQAGIYIQDSTNTSVGTAGNGNVVSGNSFGVRLFSTGGPTSGNTIKGNLIGTDPFGTAASPNSIGVLVSQATGNTIGGTTPDERNVISGNSGTGISFESGASGNIVQGNYVGLKTDGSSALANLVGISINSSTAQSNQIGGAAAGSGNVVSGNTQNGIQIFNFANNNIVEGNIVGLNAAGTASIPNANGISLFDRANSNRIGGTAAGAGNVSSGNSGSGVILIDGAQNNTVEGNKLGTDPTGMIDRGNSNYGVLLMQGSNISSVTTNNLIGGLTAGARNLISGNNSGGVRLLGATTTSNVIAGNYIGSDVTGSGYMPNNSFGIQVEAPSNTIGGATAAHRNVISGHIPLSDAGIRVQNTGTSTKIQGNYIGVNAAGDDYLFNGTNIVISGSGFEIDSNVISGAASGINIGNVSSGTITNNLMGTKADGTGSLGNGVSISLTNSSGVRIGEDAAANPAPNVIANGTQDGIRILGGGTGNIIRQNSIFNNAGLGIDLGGDGVTQNDPGDPDLANNYQNFPVINDVTTSITGSLNSQPFRSYRLEFFSSNTADPSGYGEGRTFFHSLIVVTNGVGDATFSFPNPLPLGTYISATATDTITYDTSEFSGYKQVLSPTAVKFNGGRSTHIAGQGNLVEWQTGMESNNLGFDVYRESNGQRTRVTPNLVAGSGLQTAAQLVSEQNYSWFDRDAPANAVYYVESVDVSSERELSPAIPTQSGTARTAVANSPLISELGSANGSQTNDVEPKVEISTPKEVENSAQSAISSLGGAKVLVRRAGYYRVTAEQLFANGIPTNTEPQNLRLFVRGVEQAITVNDGGDGRLDPTDSIEFYGVPANTNESETNVYYVVASQQQGRRIEFGNYAGQPSDATTFISTLERRDRNIYISSLLNGEEPNYFGAIVNQAGVDQTLNILDAVPTGTANIRVVLQGIARSEHLVSVELNGNLVGTIDFAQFMRGEGNFSVAASAIVSGPNTIRLVSVAGPTDVSVVDRIQVSYPRKLRANDGRLRFTANAGQAVTVGGFTSKGVRMFDVTDQAAPVELSTRMLREATTPDSPVRTFTATATPGGSGMRQMLAILDRFEVGEVIENTPSNLGSLNEGDLVILTNAELRPSVEPLAARRRSQGLRVAVIDVADIYDEYSFGLKSSHSIRQFLQHVYSTWNVRPSHLLFAGDASSDQNGFTGDTDKLQTRLVDTPSMETASDEWFADFDNDGTAEIAIGRLPAASLEQMETLVRKVIGYEQQSISNSATFVSDVSDGFDFAAVNGIGRSEMPAGTMFVNLDRDGTNDADIRSELLTAFASGQRMISYIGHGTTGLWRGNIFTRFDAEALSNTGRLPVLIAMTCMNGYSHNPYNLSMSESLLLNPNGGAAAVWASSGTTLPDSYGPITRELHRSLSAGATLGQAHRQAKPAITNYEVRQTWTLFGDPSMRLR